MWSEGVPGSGNGVRAIPLFDLGRVLWVAAIGSVLMPSISAASSRRAAAIISSLISTRSAPTRVMAGAVGQDLDDDGLLSAVAALACPCRMIRDRWSGMRLWSAGRPRGWRCESDESRQLIGSWVVQRSMSCWRTATFRIWGCDRSLHGRCGRTRLTCSAYADGCVRLPGGSRERRWRVAPSHACASIRLWIRLTVDSDTPVSQPNAFARSSTFWSGCK